MQFTKLLEDVRSAFRDIFERNYFITSYMTKQLTTPWIRGTVPVMAIMMALMNRRIVRIEPLDLFSGSYPSLRYAGGQTAASVDARGAHRIRQSKRDRERNSFITFRLTRPIRRWNLIRIL